MKKDSYKLHSGLKKTLGLFKKGEALKLREHANSLVKRAASENSKSTAKIAVVSYVLHKLLTKEHIVRHKKWKGNKASLSNAIASAMKALEADDLEKFGSSMDSFSKQLKKIDFYFSRFVQSLMEKSRVKYASDAYYYGLSMSSAAALTGADKKRLQEFIGATKLHEKEKPKRGIRQRLSSLKKALGE